MTDDAAAPSWWLYLVRRNDNALYCGITMDVVRRFAEHQGQASRCARALRGRAPLQLVFQCEIGDQGDALRAERKVKSLSKYQKEALVSGSLVLADVLHNQGA